MIDNTSLTQAKIYASIQKKIRLGILKPGEKLSENNLAKEFNCSRTPVREAVKTLEQDGLVVIQPKSGTYVRVYTAEETKNAIEIRAYLEALAFSLDIEKNVDITPLQECLKKMEEMAAQEEFDFTEFGQYHFKFHSLLVTLADNPFLTELYEKLHLNTLYRVFFTPMSKKDILQTHIEHKQIVQYLTDKDQEGSNFIIHHLMKRRKQLK